MLLAVLYTCLWYGEFRP